MIGFRKPTFILGVGAQKGGTSWFYQQLLKSSATNMGPLKEYHIWDAVHVPELKRFLATNPKRARKHKGIRQSMQEVDGFYEAYFHKLTSRSTPVTGDITPSYATLSAAQLSDIRKRLEGVGFTVKVVFFMRDPVERNWSGLRMQQRHMANKGKVISDVALLEKFSNFYTRDEIVKRTRYDHTITALNDSFDKKNIYLGFYESLFEPASLAKLKAFLKIRDLTFDVNERVNVSKPLHLPQDQVQACQDYYADVYDYCYTHFPQTQKLWAKTGA